MCFRKLFKKKEVKVEIPSNEWILAFGDVSNIESVFSHGKSRLSIKLKDETKLDKQKIEELGVSSIIKMSDKFTLVIENKAEEICEQINKTLSK